jgi:hypothetical protein
LITYNSNLPGDGSTHRVEIRFQDFATAKEYQSPGSPLPKPETSPRIVQVAPGPAVTQTPAPFPSPKVDRSENESRYLIRRGNKRLEVGPDGVSISKDGVNLRTDSNRAPQPVAPVSSPKLEVPAWIPLPANSAVNAIGSTQDGNQATGSANVSIPGTLEDTAQFFADKLPQEGFGVVRNGQHGNVFFSATKASRRLEITLSEEQGRCTAQLRFTDRSE